MTLRVARLRFWLWLMLECEQRDRHDSEIYYWLTRRAMGCNAWRTE